MSNRRDFLRRALAGMGVAWVGPSVVSLGHLGCSDSANDPLTSNLANLGPLGDPDENGVRIPEGFTARLVAQSGQMLPGDAGYLWHSAPDGGATFEASNGGWVYVSNSETLFGGGVGALRFSRDGELVDAYSILSQTSRNCAGGPTPWGTWLSCEEFASGRVWECDPLGESEATVWPALGVFRHEAVAVDPVDQCLYLTEDEGDGRFYRFVPDGLIDQRADLGAGTLQVARVEGGETGPVTWLDVPDPSAADTATRLQVAESTAFDGGEGIWYANRAVFFSTKGDDHVWKYDLATETLSIIYDGSGILRGVDNVLAAPTGDVLVAEDGDDQQIVVITAAGNLEPIVQLVGHDESEVTGPAFNPSRDRLYFSSQRGRTGESSDGMTFEVTGPFFG